MRPRISVVCTVCGAQVPTVRQAYLQSWAAISSIGNPRTATCYWCRRDKKARKYSLYRFLASNSDPTGHWLDRIYHYMGKKILATSLKQATEEIPRTAIRLSQDLRGKSSPFISTIDNYALWCGVDINCVGTSKDCHVKAALLPNTHHFDTLRKWLEIKPRNHWLDQLYHYLAVSLVDGGFKHELDKLGINNNALWRYLNLEVSPSVKQVDRFCEAADVEITITESTNVPRSTGSC